MCDGKFVGYFPQVLGWNSNKKFKHLRNYDLLVLYSKDSFGAQNENCLWQQNGGEYWTTLSSFGGERFQ